MNLDKFEEIFDLDYDDSIMIYCDLCNEMDKELTEDEFIKIHRKSKIEDALDDIREDLSYTSVELIECNRDYMKCPLCGATESVTYNQGSRNESLIMSSIEHNDDCPYEKIDKAIELLKDL